MSLTTLPLKSDARDPLEAFARLQAIDAITDGALACLSVDELLRELMGRLRRELRADVAIVLLIDETGKSLRARAFDGAPQKGILGLRIPFGVGVAGRIAETAAPLAVDDLSLIDSSGLIGVSVDDARTTWRSCAGVPLLVAGKLIGVVTITSMVPRRFTPEELKLMSLVADRVAPALERQRLLEDTRAANERLQQLSRQLFADKEAGRRRLAIELHEELGQLLAAAKIGIESAAALASGDAASHLAEAVTCVNEATRRVRDLALALRPSMLDDLGLAAAIRWYVDQFSRETDLRIHHIIQPLPRFSPEVEIAFYRIAQEALTNIARHARAGNVWFSLGISGDTVRLRVRDDGVGFTVTKVGDGATAGGTLGLPGMQERAALIGAAFAVSSSRGDGTDVHLDLVIGGAACQGG